MSIDAPEDNTEYATPDGHTGRLRVTRRERKLIAAGKKHDVRVTGTDGLRRVFLLAELVRIEPEETNE